MAAVQPTAVHSYTPRGAARDIFSSRNPECLLVGAAGTGKSLAALEKLNALSLKYPNMRGLIVRKTQVSLPSSALATWRKLVIPELLKAKYVIFHGGGPQDPPQYRYVNGSTINVGGLDKSSKIMSTEYDIVYVQEATELTEDDWETINTRLRSWIIPYQQIIADCNPAQPTHWLNLRCQTGKTLALQSRHEDNPALYDDDGNVTPHGKEYLNKLDNLTGVRYLRLRKGLWAAAEGVIYDNWDAGIHLIEPFTIPKEWRRYWAVDFGFTHPFVLQCWAEDPDGRLYRYREIFRTQTLVEDHARKILSIVCPVGSWIEPRPTAIICDHDAEGRATLERHLGMSTSPAIKNVTEGIQAVQARLNRAADGKPRIFLFRNVTVDRDAALEDAKRPTCTEEEIPGYVWAKGKDGMPAKEEPVKDMDDGCDTLRYIIAQVDLVGRPRIRSFSTYGESRRR
jgi:phage terminase large subunit